MSKIKTLFRYLKKMDFKNMLVIMHKVSTKSGKSKIVIFFDMIICGFKYGAGYYDYQEFEFYLLKNSERKTYLTRIKNNQIVKMYNNREAFYKLDDKVTFNEMFKKYLKRDYLLINEDNYHEFLVFFSKYQVIIAKPVDGEGGKGVEKLDINDYPNPKKIFNELLEKKALLIEECIKQHEKINKLYKPAVNTLRLFTFYNGKKAYVVNSVFKIGNGGVTDNFSSGSMYTFVDPKGKIIVPAIDQNDNVFIVHPITKKEIVDFEVPFYKEACDLVGAAATEIPEIGYIGWDVAITPKGPAIIEGNSFPGVFQIKPSLTTKRVGLIPKYQKVMQIK